MHERDIIGNNRLRNWVKPVYLKLTLPEYLRQRLKLVRETGTTSVLKIRLSHEWIIIQMNGDGNGKDTLVINSAEGEAGAREAGKAISVQPGLQGDILKHTHIDACTRTLTDACSKINIAYKTLWFSGCSTYGCDQHIDPQIKFPACGYKKHKKYLSKKAFICSPILLFTICPLLVYQLAHLMISLQTGLMIKVHSSLSLLPLIR